MDFSEVNFELAPNNAARMADEAAFRDIFGHICDVVHSTEVSPTEPHPVNLQKDFVGGGPV